MLTTLLTTDNYQPTTKKDTTMTKAFETKHLINGIDINSMSNDQIIKTIASIELEIEALQSIKVNSKVIAKQIKQSNKDIASIVKHLDKRG